MPRLTKVLLIVMLSLLIGAQAFAAPRQIAPPVPPNLAPQWAPVPQVPGVEYAPNLAADLFRYAEQFFYYSQGLWQQGPTVNGPWATVRQLPPTFYNIQAPYFKTPPGWARGKKTGWGGAPLPPGQMKKLERGGSLPPGQMKKFDGAPEP
jgi:hypothetical protein